MREDLSEVIAILDMSGSMQPLTKDTISGFNAYVQGLRESENEVRLTLILFSNQSRTVFSHQNVKSVEELTDAVYSPNGGTALTDALGYAVESTKNYVNSL